ncbi:hypothetical protein SESBI_16070 [Sesbania bispinosa]|nr:hypothetical protein SESBI_16070 [Sesbania bispinosa]
MQVTNISLLQKEAFQAHSTPASTQPTVEVGRNSPVAKHPPPDKWWLYFREFESAKDAEVTSISDHRFSMKEIVEEKLCNQSNRCRVRIVGLYNTAIMAQSMATRTAFLAHGLGHGITTLEKDKVELEKENGALQQKLKLLNNSERIIRDLTQKVVSLEIEASKVLDLSKEIEDLSTRLKTLETDHQKTVEEKDQISSSLALVQSEKEKLSSDFDKAWEEWKNEKKRTDD